MQICFLRTSSDAVNAERSSRFNILWSVDTQKPKAPGYLPTVTYVMLPSHNKIKLGRSTSREQRPSVRYRLDIDPARMCRIDVYSISIWLVQPHW